MVFWNRQRAVADIANRYPETGVEEKSRDVGPGRPQKEWGILKSPKCVRVRRGDHAAVNCTVLLEYLPYRVLRARTLEFDQERECDRLNDLRKRGYPDASIPPWE